MAAPTDIIALAVQYGLPAAGGVIVGAVGTLFGPWANWGAAAAQKRSESRRELVAAWRQLLGQTTIWRFDDGGQLFLTHQRDYSSLRGHLRRALVRDLERQYFGSERLSAEATAQFRRRLIGEISRIEREWRLV